MMALLVLYRVILSETFARYNARVKMANISRLFVRKDEKPVSDKNKKQYYPKQHAVNHKRHHADLI